jgi:hypothetical protein
MNISKLQNSIISVLNLTRKGRSGSWNGGQRCWRKILAAATWSTYDFDDAATAEACAMLKCQRTEGWFCSVLFQAIKIELGFFIWSCHFRRFLSPPPGLFLTPRKSNFTPEIFKKLNAWFLKWLLTWIHY